jgi:crotonobetainyl-CoA:carnitine CoA-transferase CaiB-like acyl-CoA transferase
VNLLRSPINLSACPHPEAFTRAAPDPGQHSTELLREAGFGDDEIAQLMKEGTIA